MPVKGQLTKSRTAKSTKKGPKLKWWYILPVIAIVAVAGYAIVRYSQAAAERDVQYPGNGIEGGGATQNKGNVQVRVAQYYNSVNARVGANNVFEAVKYPNMAGKWVCAEVWVGNNPAPKTGVARPGSWNYYVSANITPLVGPIKNLGALTVGSSVKTYFKQNGWDRQCVRLAANTGVPIKQAEVRIWPGAGTNFLGVSKVWWQDNL